jgi:hypothetical protein
MRTQRQEFSDGVTLEIIRRATDEHDRLLCEKCGGWLKSRHEFEVHHVKAEGLQMSPRARLEAKDGLLLCLFCHDEQSTLDMASIAKAKRVEKKQPLKLGGMPEIFRRFMGGQKE